MIKVNGVEIPTPSQFNAYPNLREDSSENALGDIKRKIISCRWKIEMSWDYLTDKQYEQLTTIKFLKEFECTFPSPMGTMITKTMYGGEIKAEAFSLNKDGTVKSYLNCSFNFVQTKADKYTGGAY